MTTGQRIKSARKKANMTQAELAQKLDIPFQSVSQWERGIRSPKIETLAKIANALNVSLSDLLWEGDEPIPDDAFILVAGKRGAYIVDSQRRDAISLRNFIIDDVKKLVENLHIANLDDLWSIQDHLENCVNILNARKQGLSNSEDLTETPKHKKEPPQD